MSIFVGRPPFSNLLWVAIETMQFHIAQTKIFLRTPWFPIQGIPMNNLAPMKNCPGGGGVQGNLNWMPGYQFSTRLYMYSFIVAIKWNLVTMIYTNQLGFSDRDFLMKVAPAEIYYVYPARTCRLISSRML